jgi:hypothetical protein
MTKPTTTARKNIALRISFAHTHNETAQKTLTCLTVCQELGFGREEFLGCQKSGDFFGVQPHQGHRCEDKDTNREGNNSCLFRFCDGRTAIIITRKSCRVFESANQFRPFVCVCAMGLCVSVETVYATFHDAAFSGNAHLISRLLRDRSLDVNHIDADGMSALHKAASRQQFECCKILIEHGANLSLRDAGLRAGRNFVVVGGFV